MTNDDVYRMLIYYYLDEISDWHFEQEMKLALKNGISERAYLSRYFASRIPGEPNSKKMMMKIMGAG